MKNALRLLVTMCLLSPAILLAQSYAIDPVATDIRILVYRGGLLKGLGHNHIISVADVSGTIELESMLQESNIQLRFPVASLLVDNATLRKEEGDDFSADVSQKDKDGTRKNMLGRKLLDVANFPDIRIASIDVSGRLSDLTVDAEITIRNQRRNVSFPVKVELNDREIIASGELVVTHADLGLKPFRAVLGTLRVRDEILLRYRIVAERGE